MKYCVDCKWFEQVGTLYTPGQDPVHLCNHPKLLVEDRVVGKRPTFAAGNRYDEECCGKEGKLWKEKDKISLTDPTVILAGIRQFGLAPDGSDLRDLSAAIARLTQTGTDR